MERDCSVFNLSPKNHPFHKFNSVTGRGKGKGKQNFVRRSEKSKGEEVNRKKVDRKYREAQRATKVNSIIFLFFFPPLNVAFFSPDRRFFYALAKTNGRAAVQPAARNQLGTIRSSVNRNTSQLMVHLEPVILRTPFGRRWAPERRNGTRPGGKGGKRKKKKKRTVSRCIYAGVSSVQGCSEICGCRLPAKVVGRLRGEEFPHLEAASSARSAWVRRLCAPRAAIAIQAMLHETNPSDLSRWTTNDPCRSERQRKIIQSV